MAFVCFCSNLSTTAKATTERPNKPHNNGHFFKQPMKNIKIRHVDF